MCGREPRRLLKAGASPRAWDAESLTPLHLAANNGHLQTARALVSYWAPVDESDIEPEEPVHPKLRTDQERERAKAQGNGRVQVRSRRRSVFVMGNCLQSSCPQCEQLSLGPSRPLQVVLRSSSDTRPTYLV
jgi:ankyrin repeat protein